MNKTDLTKQLAESLNVSHSESLRYMQALQEIMTAELERKGSIMIQGFGQFNPWLQAERPARNPQTGTPCIIPERMSVKFKPGKKLLELLNRERGGVQ